MGGEPFTEEQIAFAEKYHPGTVDRPPNRLAELGVDHMPVPTCATCHMSGLEGAGVTHDVTEQPFDEPIETTYFDLWHYSGRTSKHGAFMGGAAGAPGGE